MGVDANLVEHQQARAEAEAFTQVVGDHEHRQPGFAPQLQQQLVHVFANAGVEGAEGFVQQQYARFHDQRLGDGQALLHAAGELRRVFAQRVAQADLEQQCCRLFPCVLLGAAEQPAQQRCAG